MRLVSTALVMMTIALMLLALMLLGPAPAKSDATAAANHLLTLTHPRPGRRAVNLSDRFLPWRQL
jgi:hypothetical protein